ncbi:MAG: hypothetical protein WB760_20750 [Xanthobacteraceae bacterium]
MKQKSKLRFLNTGMISDCTEEKNLGEGGNPAARIEKTEVAAAFSKRRPEK